MEPTRGGKAWTDSEVTEPQELLSEPLEFTAEPLEISHCSAAFSGAAQAVWPPQLLGWHWTSAEPRHWFHPHHHSHKAVRSHGPLALLLMLPFSWIFCSTTVLFPPPVPSSCSQLSVHCAVWPWVLQYPQESSWVIHHLPHGAGALPCHTPCQDEDFTRVRHTSVSWLRVSHADFTFWAKPSEAGGREHQQNPQPSFWEKDTCCMTLLQNRVFLKAMFTLPLPWWGQPWILESTALT